MRTSKHKPSKHQTPDDEAFERMYRTIPNLKAGTTASPGSQATDQLDPDGSGEKGGRGKRGKRGASAPGEKPKWKRILKKVLIVLAILLALAGLWLGWKLVANWVKVFGWQGLTDVFKSTTLKGEDLSLIHI